MALNYVDHVGERLLGWKSSDPSLFAAAERTLRAIDDAPASYGKDGTPLVPRLVTFLVPGRGIEYVITWEHHNGVTMILSASSTTELVQIARLRSL